MTPGSTLEALNALRSMGASLTIEGDKVRISYRCPAASLPSVRSAIGLLKERKAEVIACLTGGEKASTIAARLHPLVGRRVRTPDGTGELIEVLRDRVRVALDGEGLSNGKAGARFFAPTDICPLEIM